MKTSIKNRKKQLLALCLSVMMLSSFTALAACKDNQADSSSSSSSSSSTSTEKDESLVLNGGFETFNTNDGKNVIGTSATGWSRATSSSSTGSASSSQSASGIIDTSEENWKQMTTSNVDVSKLVDNKAEAEKQWKNLTVKDKLDYYAAWKKANKDKTISKELSFYESFNIDNEDLPTCENPGTHDGDAENTNVLMIHNEYPAPDSTSYNIIGTAQKYTSSSTVTVKSGTSVEFSVWVKTSDLESSATSGDAQDVVGKGAYISISHSVGGKTMDALEVKNINTASEADNETNGWVQYSFYLRGAAYVDTTFNIVLGLGQGGKTDKLEYVNGYAFFDDIECNVITNEDFDTRAKDLLTIDFNSKKEEKTVDTYVSSDTKFAMDYYSSFVTEDFLTASEENTITIKPTTETSNKKVYTAALGVEGTEVYNGLGFSTANDKTQVFENAEQMASSDNDYLKKAYEKYFKDVEFLNGEKLLMILSADGAAYTANSNKEFEVKANSYLAISCYVKTSKMNGFTGAGITLIDGNNKTSISSIDTTTIASVEIGEKEDFYEDWQQCLFFVENTTEEDRKVSLSFNYGPTTVVSTTKAQYYAGFAAFSKFETYEMSEIEFEGAVNGTYSKVVSLTDNTVTTGDSGFDSTSGVHADAIETGFATPQTYKGVYDNSAYISNKYSDTATNTNKDAGLLNKEYEANYKDILTKLGGETWKDVFGTATQPLVIYNEKDQENAYGYFGKITSLAANTYKTISLRVKVSAGATANIYLVDMADDTHSSMLSIGNNVIYWYDDDGNVCAKDPADEHFNAKKDVAFKLQSNGLYKVNTAWEGAKDVDANAYFANLANYEKDSATGNLLVAEGGVTYNYNDIWNGVGKDGIAFYAKDGKYYAEDSFKTEVFDFATTSLAPRYAAEEKKDLCFEVTDTKGEWATVTFYVHTGDTAKSYRLEVWSGSRDGAQVNKAGSYVFFDSYSPASLDETSFNALIDERKEDVSEDDYFESVFSFFDNAKYLRYNELVDDNKVGYAYESYVPSSQASGVAYLKYESENIYELYANYALSEVTVTPDAEDDDTTTDTEDDHDHGEEMNPMLLASSIAVAAALLVAIVAVAVRKILASIRKKNGYTAPVKKEKKEKKSK